MRTSTAAWTAALAVMSMRGPFTTAEAAPARQQDSERPRHFFPKHMKRGYNHTVPAIESSSSIPDEPDSSSIDSTSSAPPLTDDSSTLFGQHSSTEEVLSSTHSRRSRSSTKSTPPEDLASLVESLISAGVLPETKNAVVTTTLTLADNPLHTATYTITYTETSSPAPREHKSKSSPPVPLLTSVSVPLGSSSDTSSIPQESPDRPTTTTKSTKSKHTLFPGTANSAFSSLLSFVAPTPSSQPPPPPHHTRTHKTQNTTSSTSSIPLSSSTVPPSASDGTFGLPSLGSSGGVLNPTAPSGSVIPHLKPHGTGVHHGPVGGKHDSSSSSKPGPSSEGLLSDVLPTPHAHRPTAHGIPILQSSLPPVPSSGGLLSDLLPTGHSHTRSNHGRPDPQNSQPPKFPKVHGSDGILGHSTGGLLPLNEPSPTAARTNKPASADSSSTTDSPNIIVGISTFLSELPSVSLPLGSDASSDSKPTKSGVLSALGLTGVPTGVSLPAQSVLPTGAVNGGRKRPQGSADQVSSTDSGLLPLADTLTSAVGGLTSNLAPSVPAVVGSLTDTVQSVGSKVTDGINGPLSPAVATGTAGTVSNVAESIGSKTTIDVSSIARTASAAVDSIGSDTTNDPTSPLPDVASTPAPTVDSVTDQAPQATGSLPGTTSSGTYTLTGGGNTFTVPIPPSAPASVPVTGPTQPSPVTTGYSTPDTGTITTPTTDSPTVYPTQSTPESDESPSPTPNSTSPNAGYTLSTAVPLTGGTTLAVGASKTAQGSYSTSKEPAAVPPTPTSATAPETTNTDEHTKAPQSIRPTGTDTYTSMTFPKSWQFAPTTGPNRVHPDGISTDQVATAASPTGIPSYIPQLVQPPNGMPPAPLNATLIQLGFLYGLNYPFVVGNPDSASQIFAYLPEGIAHGLGIQRHEVVMNALMPWDTSAELNYITTLAQVYVPSQYVASMEMSLHMPLSTIYSHQDSTVKTLMGMINPTIPILPGPGVDGTSSSAWYNNPAATKAPSSEDAAPIGGDSGSSNRVKGSTVGIGLGAVGGAAVYAAAMVFVARRYRKKRQGHQRASSVHTGGEMSQRSGGMTGFFMSGANGRGSGTGSGGRGSRTSAGSSNGRSVREQGISAPLMAENSLGWN